MMKTKDRNGVRLKVSIAEFRLTNFLVRMKMATDIQSKVKQSIGKDLTTLKGDGQTPLYQSLMNHTTMQLNTLNPAETHLERIRREINRRSDVLKTAEPRTLCLMPE